METIQELIAARREKVQALRNAGVQPYPYTYERSHTIEQFYQNFDSIKESEQEISIAGRMVAKRVMGKASFAHIQDETGRLQIYVKRDDIGTDPYQQYKKLTDLGDWMGLRGKAMITKTGEKTLHVTEWTMLSKAIRPLPVVKEDAETGKRYHEFTDPDERYRNRPLDLVVNPEVRKIFRTRARVISFIRRFLDDRRYLEVETPALQPLYGGGTARPFVTLHNQLKKNLYLRIADELYLKRLIVGGLDRVYEIAKDFRNEGVDRTHNPEFTMMECYIAFEDYMYHVNLVESMVSEMVKDIHGSYTLKYEDEEIDFAPPWGRVRFFDALNEKTGEDLLGADLQKLKEVAKRLHVPIPEGASVGKMQDELFSELVEPTFTRPTFVLDYPVELSPLAKRHRDNPLLVERFEAYVAGMEICNAFSELNDPDDQRARFEEQVRARSAGDEEAMPLDEDYLEALELGLPPTAGLGLGIDRLAMILTNSGSIRDVVLFPLLRDKEQHSEEDAE
ncbi:lysine--tRNA ligase [bacterium]|nr:lysine--tRNA ligase [bacterium]